MGATLQGREVSPQELADAIKLEALRLGFQGVGIAPASALKARRQDLERWITSGFTGELRYMETFFERQARFLAHVQDVKSIIVVLASYSSCDLPPGSSLAESQEQTGRIARYARGRDYHAVIQKRLRKLETFLRNHTENPRTALSIDTAPLQERVLAEMAGLGFFGKNTCLIRPRGGSFNFLAALLTNVTIAPDKPISWDCGACTLCLEACPTGALVKPYELDARRCISYLTIELKTAIEPELRPFVGDWLFGCDICQEVCPYNRQRAQGSAWEEWKGAAGAGAQLPLADLLGCRTEEQFAQRFAGTPLMRAKREGLLRNAAVVAGNLGSRQLIPDLRKAMMDDSSPLVRQHAAWALEKIEGSPKS